MSAACTFEGCTVADTQRCALEKDPDACPNRIAAIQLIRGGGGARSATEEGADLGAPVLGAPAENPSFPRSTTLGTAAINEMMSGKYVSVVGILGYPDSGKTACLASLYLLASNDRLTGWSFADSSSLMAFEEISRGARRWNGGELPDQMTVHTEMTDDRQPGFLHLRLRRDTDGRCVDLALPDLPGEWTKDLVATSRTDRFEFLRAADVLWVVVDGRTLQSVELRQGVISRLGQLAGRLRAMLGESLPRMLLAVTHRDQAETPAPLLERIRAELGKHKVAATVVPVAPFSDHDEFKPGFGLVDLINKSVAQQHEASSFWPVTKPENNARAYLSHRRSQ
ncbi:hypothetical protein CTTA_4580 [Comamonas testosteroni]|uniref:Double-GTPase 2 domain-containing protein n=1 Tax=Comamonas testosteroni TaxID=285 RepID=A0A5A7MLJ7_COMTE|nr:hypothetical protein [Comamonas testosteroni]GEQ77575.1 hypothetical protein CTTA_4580 [Comamonas testosteroni]